ncbi:MAG TPA: TIGR00730 family Rossman fold protein, partial [Vicinamibacterales bacterium]
HRIPILSRCLFQNREYVAARNCPNFNNRIRPARASLRCDNQDLPLPEDQISTESSEPANDRRPVAYREEAFLQSPESRPLRILSEYLWPLAHFQEEKIQDTIVFFGSARIEENGPLGRYYQEARELARLLTIWTNAISDSAGGPEPRRRFVVCSGGGPGIMEAANRGARDAGGKTVGLNIGLPFEQRPNPYITPELSFEFHYFFMRKFWFAYLAKALVVFPGGFGTLDEMFEILTLMQTEKLAKQIQIILYGTEYWDPILSLEPMADWGAINPADMRLVTRADTPEQAFEYLKAHLTTHHLVALAEETRAPGIAKTRS